MNRLSVPDDSSFATSARRPGLQPALWSGVANIPRNVALGLAQSAGETFASPPSVLSDSGLSTLGALGK